MFILKLICCLGGTAILAGGITTFINWWEKRPIVLDSNGPVFYITKTYKEIKK